MTLRDIAIRIGYFTAALGAGSWLHVEAGELQSEAPRMNERCSVSIAPLGKAVSCERIGGHLRIDLIPPIPNPSGFGRPGASPAAVRTDSGITANGHLYLPGGEPGFEPFRR